MWVDRIQTYRIDYRWLLHLWPFCASRTALGLLILSTVLFSSVGKAQTVALKPLQTGAAYPFLLHIPDVVSAGEKPPLIIFLHGRSLSGRDLNRVSHYGVLYAMKKGRKIDAFVAAPQLPYGQFWKPEKVNTVLDYILANYRVDADRVYVVGMSLGGYGTLNFVSRYPERIAAAVALCGGGDLEYACNLAHTNLWIKHGKMDEAVPYTESTKIFEAIKACRPDAPVHLTLYPRAGHGVLEREFHTDTLYSWLFQFSRQPLKPQQESK